MVDVPLIHIEKSVARVGETLLMAIFGTFVAKQQAKAKHIEQQADLERRSQRNAARRQEAMKDANHRRELAAQEQIEKLNELLVQSFPDILNSEFTAAISPPTAPPPMRRLPRCWMTCT